MQTTADRESLADATNPLGLDGIEFIEFVTAKPQALGQVLEMMGFRPVARHRSREVLLYRQGEMNIIINAHSGGLPRTVQPSDTPVISAIALRVRDAASAYRHALDRGAWAVPTNVEVMELNIPAVHGVGASRLYFVDRYKDFSIYDVDFTLIPTVDPKPPALTGLHWFGVVQYIGNDRMEDWTEFYAELFGFKTLPDDKRYGILPKGRVLQSPCGSFLLAADRTRARHSRCQRRRVAAACGLRHTRRAGHGRDAAPARCRFRRITGCAFRNARRADANLPRRRDVRAGPARALKQGRP